MTTSTCFVIMPIGEQTYGKIKVTAEDLRKRYDDLIREALLVARPNLEIWRADEVAVPGTITTDILTRIMHSDFVVADVSFPNPNVFYELGLRHACRPGTIIIRDIKAPKPPFDIAHLRHIEYENTPSGLKGLSAAFSRYFEQAGKSPERPDNHFLELAKITQYQFPQYSSSQQLAPEIEAMMAVLGSPELFQLLMMAGQGQKVEPEQFARAFVAEPEVTRQMLVAMSRSGQLNLAPSGSTPRHRLEQKRGRR